MDALADARFFVLRSPLLPTSELLAMAAAVDEMRAHGATYEAVVERVQDRVLHAFEQPAMEEGLEIATPSLAGAWRRRGEKPLDQSARRSLMAYYLRAAYRPTPFGLFAGIACGSIGANTDLTTAPIAEWSKRVRLDYASLIAWVHALPAPAKDKQRLRVNSSMYEIAGEVRYVVEMRIADGQTRYELLTARRDEGLNAVLDFAETREAFTHSELLRYLLQLGASEEAADAYIGQLLATQIVHVDRQPPLTGNSPLRAAIENMHGCQDRPRNILQGIEEELAEIESQPLGQSIGALGILQAELKHEGFEAPKTYVHAELIKAAPALVLSHAVVERLVNGARVLAQIGSKPSTEQGFNPQRMLASFREAFVERYGTAVMPLSVVLDEHSGIGWDGRASRRADRSSLLEGLPFRAADRPPPFTNRDRYMLRLARSASELGKATMELSESDLHEISTAPDDDLPSSFAVMAQLAATDAAAIDRGCFSAFLTGVLAASGAAWLARFAGSDPQLADLLRAHLRKEEIENPDAIFAEVVHAPGTRAANIIARPVLRDFELPYLAVAGVPLDRQVRVRQLLITVVGDRIVLWSTSQQRQVIPRISTAFYPLYTDNLGVYRFLYVLQFQDAWVGGIQWGAAAESLPFLPRLQREGVVFSLARWGLSQSDVDALGSGDPGTRVLRFREVRERKHIPRFITFDRTDHKLFLDLDNPVCLDLLRDRIRSSGRRIVTEAFPSPSDTPVRDMSGAAYSNEIIIPITRRMTRRNRAASGDTPSLRVHVEEEPAYTVGSEWFYAKLYGNPVYLDSMVTTALPEFIRALRAQVSIDRWFFLRYFDPHPHIRLRAHSHVATTLWSSAIPLLNGWTGPLLREHLLSDCQIGTYRPEWRRYGGYAVMAIAEEFFSMDSEFVCEALASARTALDRFRVAVQATDDVLSICAGDYAARRSLAASLLKTYGEEPVDEGEPGRARRLSAQLFRAHRPLVEDAILRKGASCLARLLRDRASKAHEYLDRIERARNREYPYPSLTDIVGSLTHMLLNRLFLADHRRHEYAVYYFLERAYNSLAARHSHVPPGGGHARVACSQPKPSQPIERSLP